MSSIRAESDGNEKVPDFFGVLGIDDIETYDPEEVWARSSRSDSVVIPIGYLRVDNALIPELSTLDLSRDGRNGAVQGSTGTGRSYFLRSMVLSLAARYGPDRVSLLLADGMGPVVFRGFEALPHTVANVWCDNFSEESFDALTSAIVNEIQRRAEVLALHHCSSSAEYRRQSQACSTDGDWPPLPDLVAVIDDFCWILQEHPERRNQLVDIVSAGVSTGVHLILAGEHFTESMLAGLDAQLGFRFSLRVNRPEHSRALLGSDDAVYMAGRLHGKMLRKLPSDLYPTPMVGFHIDARYPSRRDALSENDDDEVYGDKMSELLLEKLARTHRSRAVEPWQLGDVQDNLSRPHFGSGLRRHR